MEQAFDKLINDIISDNTTYQFPVLEFEVELTLLFLDRKNHRKHLKEITNRMSKEYSKTLSHIFLKVLLLHFEVEDLEELSNEEYYQRMEKFIAQLYKIRITIIPKDSDDYEMLKIIQ